MLSHFDFNFFLLLFQNISLSDVGHLDVEIDVCSVLGLAEKILAGLVKLVDRVLGVGCKLVVVQTVKWLVVKVVTLVRLQIFPAICSVPGICLISLLLDIGQLSALQG